MIKWSLVMTLNHFNDPFKKNLKKKINESLQQNYKCQFQVVPKLKTNKSLKLILVDIKANSSIIMKLAMAGVAQNKQKCLIFIVIPRATVENQITRVGQLLRGQLIYMK